MKPRHGRQGVAEFFSYVATMHIAGDDSDCIGDEAQPREQVVLVADELAPGRPRLVRS